MKFSLIYIFCAFALPLIFGSCNQDNAKIDFLKSDVESLEDQLKALKDELSEIEDETYQISRDISDLESKKRNVRMYEKQEIEAIKELSDVKAYDQVLSDSLRKLDSALASWKEASRHSFKGLAIQSFTPNGSPILADPTVVEVSDAEVSFRYTGGDVTVPFVNLPDSLREAFVDETLYAPRTTLQER
jgi:cell division protein FtsB